MKYSFNLRRHWWFDAGIAGLYTISKSGDERLRKFNVNVTATSLGLDFEGADQDTIRSFLETCYEILAERHWNISTVKQKENPKLVVYDKENDTISLMPKRKPAPIVSMFVGPRSWRGDGIPYKELKEPLKSRVDEFLEKNKTKLWGSDNKLKLLYSQPVCHQILKILPETKKSGKEETCSVCGNKSKFLSEVGLPSFLLFASSNATKSFNSQGKNPAKICWECDFISKFAVESASYKQTGDSTFIIQVTSPDTEKLIEMQKEFGSLSSMRTVDDKYYYSNIGLDADSLIRYCKKPHELLWSFMVEKYNLLARESTKEEQTDEPLEDDFLKDFLESISASTVQIYLLYTVDSGDTFLTKNLILYDDLGYFFRLIHHMKQNHVDIKKVFNSLYEENNLFREKILKNVLKKHSILQLMEQISFKKVLAEEPVSMNNILNFTTEYQKIIRGDNMNKEQIETAVNLGKQIVIQAVERAKAENESEKQALKKIKGDLYQLRKSRTRTDFLGQLNNLQFRYGISVSNHILDGLLEEVDFEDFRAYCILGALNVYNTKNRDKEE